MKKGFTLIELLAVIVILAIILLIAMPIVLNVIREARMGAFNSTGFGIVKTAETEYFRRALDGATGDVTYTFTGTTQTVDPDTLADLDFSGKAPTAGGITVESDGTIFMAISDGVHCAYKTAGSTEVKTVYLEDVSDLSTEVTDDDCTLVNLADFINPTTP